MSNDGLSEYLTLSEVSKLLKVHPNTLRNWDKNGTLKPIRLGERKIRRCKKEDVIKFLEQL
jgi:excisionase family DNA binding protein